MENLTPLQVLAEAYYRQTVENKELRKINSSLAIRCLVLELENMELEKKAHEAVNELLGDVERVKVAAKEFQVKKEKYQMCKEQPAQIDCRQMNCIWHKAGGHCTNISPAITLNGNDTYVCWTHAAH